MSQFLIVFVRLLVVSLWVLMLGRVLLSWVDPQLRTQLGRAVFGMTEPVLAPIRRVLPQAGMLDLAPLVVLLTLGVLMRLVI